MGNNAATSVVDANNRAHDVKNLFVVDGSSLVTSTRGQPTGTIFALGFRAGDSIPWAEVWERMNRLAESEQIDGVWLYPSGSGDTVSFAPRIRHAPQLSAAGGFAYDNTLGGRVWFAGLSENLLGLGLGLSSKLALGGLRTLIDGAGLGFEVNLTLRRDEVRGSALTSTRVPTEARLGWDTFLQTRPANEDRADVRYDIHAAD